MGGKTPHGAIDADADAIFAGVHLVDEAPEISPERALWLRVIGQSWYDAFEASDSFLEVSDKPGGRDGDVIRAEARRWLTIDFGSDAEDRETVCDLAGLSEPMLRNAARKKLSQVKAQEEHTAEVIEPDRAFGRLLADADAMAPADVDAALSALATLESVAAA